MTERYYLAYGSNLHPLRLAQRVPSARLVGTTPLPGYRLAFHKRGMDGSAKCDLELTDDSGSLAYGAVYSLATPDIARLDRLEDLGTGYFKEQVTLRVDGVALSAFVYFASHTHVAPDLLPFDWYLGFVLAGARRHGFPAEYVAQVAAVPHQTDPNEGRRRGMLELLERLDG
ncbi:MAG TPA: gamma-glutamylcyclotransferase [Gammaproteobacteria bacterium]|nr:gamma-glutamylcyclotransferase [Gammaproteobacteria bacterium]HRP87181.1 gamma-glutamylcyclotransferase [Gammaproteobacteria bacterium]